MDDPPATVEQLVSAFAATLEEIAPEMPEAARARGLQLLHDELAVIAEHSEYMPTVQQVSEAWDRQSGQP